MSSVTAFASALAAHVCAAVDASMAFCFFRDVETDQLLGTYAVKNFDERSSSGTSSSSVPQNPTFVQGRQEAGSLVDPQGPYEGADKGRASPEVRPPSAVVNDKARTQAQRSREGSLRSRFKSFGDKTSGYHD